MLPRLPSPGRGLAGVQVVTVVVRPAVPDDAEALGGCHLACWEEAYAHLVDPARLAPFLADVEGFVARWRGGSTGPAVVVAGDGLVGFGSVRPAYDDVPRT